MMDTLFWSPIYITVRYCMFCPPIYNILLGLQINHECMRKMHLLRLHACHQQSYIRTHFFPLGQKFRLYIKSKGINCKKQLLHNSRFPRKKHTTVANVTVSHTHECISNAWHYNSGPLIFVLEDMVIGMDLSSKKLCYLIKVNQCQ